MCRHMRGCWSSGFRWAQARRGCLPLPGKSVVRAPHSPSDSLLQRCWPKWGACRANSGRRQTRHKSFCQGPRLRRANSCDTAIGSPPGLAHGAWAHTRLSGDTGHDPLHTDPPGARRTHRHTSGQIHDHAKRASVCRWPRDQARSSRQVRTTATGKAKAPYSPSWTAYTAFRHDGSRSHHCHSGYCDPVRDRTVLSTSGSLGWVQLGSAVLAVVVAAMITPTLLWHRSGSSAVMAPTADQVDHAHRTVAAPGAGPVAGARSASGSWMTRPRSRCAGGSPNFPSWTTDDHVFPPSSLRHH